MNFIEYEKLIEKYVDNHRSRQTLWETKMSIEEFEEKFHTLLDEGVKIKLELIHNYPLQDRG